MNKVSAFTILELSITMLISAILIAVTYACYNIINSSYKSFGAKNEKMAVVNSLDHLIKWDFEHGGIILKSNDNLRIVEENQTIQYGFYPDFVIRYSTRTDTFRIQTQQAVMSFEGAVVNGNGDTDEQNRVDDLSVTLYYHQRSFSFYYHKLYSSADLINRYSYAVN